MIIPTFLKWVGGKRKIIDKIDKQLPKNFNRYFEPFIGGASVFFYIKQKYNPRYCMISDINEDLIETYKAVRDNPKKLIKKLKYFKKNNSEEFYYQTRKKFNEKKILGIKRCATFIYLNKTCFNGIYRVNLKNEFNVPFGKYKNPSIFDKRIIFLASELLQGVKIVCQDYSKILKYVKKEDFVYLDPCFDPLKKTSFTEYTPLKFSEDYNIRLADFVETLHEKGVKVVFSNNDTLNIRKYYPKKKGFKISVVYSFRSVGSLGKYRKMTPEVIIKN